MAGQHPIQEATALLAGRRVALIGDRSRTWYEDVAKLVEILIWLKEIGAEVWIADVLPFDIASERAASVAGVELQHCGYVENAKRLGLALEDFVLEAVDAVVVLPRRKARIDEIRNELLVPVAGALNLPILAFTENETCLWVDPSL